MLHDKTVAFLGAGSMAEAMISGLVRSEFPTENIIATNRSNEERLSALNEKYGIKGIKLKDLPFDQIDVMILAMKPKDVDSALKGIKDHIKPNQLILSVLAGITTTYLEQNLHNGQQVVRVMPNTSSAIGESATAISPGHETSENNVRLTQDLLGCIGEVYTIEEKDMDIFTGLAGSGPAYFYYLMEHMEKQGSQAGFDLETTREIIAQTIVGAAKMVQEQDYTPTVLREKVTSPNGTTAAGLNALDENGGGKAIAKAVEHAAKRSKEISEQIQESLLVSSSK
ncbi:pyrroline-5-carboxylate reductase [Metabacillus litoralis]|uniref:pyrroline-5-carboxylate reductase n=1 Tax=Metabacillus TaxID=2675233 RepID=UPI000EF613BB|nr:pyrroline-5-carboxylate reductase [Metabacillus litoralis]MCM3160086.1 pyrroline-5-carboxylate reductase [Metabacillus litoralis]MCM3408670.1 pyrroline-5-carboxylate reductase [Metabacillus litoralis]UHA59669.1 pyrroline-5-carboxylate reductase [Metabacillus litoralis]